MPQQPAPRAAAPDPLAVADPFAPNVPDPAAAPIPVPQTVSRDALAGMGGAAATGAAVGLGAAAGIASNMASTRAPQRPHDHAPTIHGGLGSLGRLDGRQQLRGLKTQISLAAFALYLGRADIPIEAALAFAAQEAGAAQQAVAWVRHGRTRGLVYLR